MYSGWEKKVQLFELYKQPTIFVDFLKVCLLFNSLSNMQNTKPLKQRAD